MKLEQLTENERTDMKYRREAERVYRELMMTFEYHKEVPYEVFETHKGSLVMNIADYVFVDDDPFLLILEPISHGKDGGFGFYKNKHPVVVLYHLPKTKDFLMAMKTAKTTFIHEYIHYLDWVRMGRKMNVFQQSGRSSVGPVEYYNNSIEYNAYYQETLQKIDERLREDPEMSRFFLQSFDSFFSFFVGRANTHYLDNLNNKNRRKLMKRLYDYFVTHKDEYTQ